MFTKVRCCSCFSSCYTLAQHTRNCLHCKLVYKPSGLKQKWCKDCCPHGQAQSLLKKFDLSWREFQDLLAKQDSKCALCDMTLQEFGKNLHVDHDHCTGRVRGLLCFRCNVGISHIERERNWLERAVRYLSNEE